MNQPLMSCAPILVGLLATASPAQDNPFAWPGFKLPSGERFEFRLHFPGGITVDTPRPIAVGFVDGEQGRGPVYDTMNQFFWMQVPKEGVGIVLPVAKKGTPFHAEGGLDGIGYFLGSLRGRTRLKDNGLHAIGFGEQGAKSALAAVKAWPSEFRSLTILTFGKDDELPPPVPDEKRYGHVRRIVLAPAVDDAAPPAWKERIALWQERGWTAEWRQYEAEDAGPQGSGPDVTQPLWKALREQARVEVSEAEAPVHELLDQFHSAAARVDSARYWALWHEDGEFQAPGLDEAWPLATFRKRFEARYPRRPGLILVPASRVVKIAGDGKSAQVEEILGSTRFPSAAAGRGELVVVDGKWRVKRYRISGLPKGALFGPRQK